MPTAVALPSSDGTVAAKTHVSTHPDVIRIEFQGGDYNSYAVAARPYRAGEVIATFDHATPSDEVRYSTVQTGEKSHLELNSEYVSHFTQPPLLQPFLCAFGRVPRRGGRHSQGLRGRGTRHRRGRHADVLYVRALIQSTPRPSGTCSSRSSASAGPRYAV